MEQETSTTVEADEPQRPGLRQFSGLLWDVGVPLVGYYALHLLGASDWVALLVATLAAGLRLVWVAVRAREVTWFAAVMLAVFGLGLALAFVGGDPRFLLVKDSFGTALVGLVFLASLFSRKPLTLSAFQTWQPRQAREMEEYYRTIPPVRHTFRLSAVVWGVGLLLEATLRIPLIYLLPIDVMVGVSTAMMVTVIVGLSIWNGWYGARTGARARAWAEEHHANA
ncbi:VC0807 family protein [Actinomycetospora cinnamomea]|uniref:Intracellular septation protein A n=1 Tax=Actinomycetospora cinnamomea TaxID=663609 RepID=A0A2U1FFZ3_9PSEU|nr:VC0807 family protein [Actinomycetospora cinnamomea]PVZ11082.1 intracellular septation protein A [Actinomycetospora cinnamomea]